MYRIFGRGINAGLTLTIHNEIIQFKITEGEDKVPRVLIKE